MKSDAQFSDEQADNVAIAALNLGIELNAEEKAVIADAIYRALNAAVVARGRKEVK